MTAYVRRVRAADVAGEDVAAVHAGANRQADVGRDDVAQRAQHSFLVLPGARRRAAGEVELDGVDVDVRLEPRQPVGRRTRAPTAAASVSMRSSSASGPSAAISSSVPRELHERDRHLPVLGLAARHGEVRAQRRGHELVEVRAGDVGRRRDRAGTRLEPAA